MGNRLRSNALTPESSSGSFDGKPMGNRFIAIFGPAPDDCANSGVYQRVLGVDTLLKSHQRIYISYSEDPKEFSFREQRIQGGAFKLILSRALPEHQTILRDVFQFADSIYVHSLFHLKTFLPLLEKFNLGNKIILDVHGVVPEELALSGNITEATQYEELERVAFQTCGLFVMVSEAMEKHFRQKYLEISFESVLLPIFSLDEVYVRPEGTDAGRETVIYAGGYERWQNVELMLDSVQTLAGRFRVCFYSFCREQFEEALKKRGMTEQVQFGTALTGAEMRTVLHGAQFGFVLRSDSIVNRVSCPTKLIEYLHCGVIPVVLSADIGDFNALGFRYITLEHFVDGRVPSLDVRHEMILKNHEVVRVLRTRIPLAVDGIENQIARGRAEYLLRSRVERTVLEYRLQLLNSEQKRVLLEDRVFRLEKAMSHLIELTGQQQLQLQSSQSGVQWLYRGGSSIVRRALRKCFVWKSP